MQEEKATFTMETTSVHENVPPMSFKAKLITSFAIYFCTFALGLSLNVLGSALVELSDKFETDISTISKVFSVLTVSFLVGALLSGFIFNYVNRQVMSAIFYLIMGTSVILLPQSSSIAFFFVAAGFAGVAAGGYDTAQIVWIIEMWEQPRVFIQIQHFAYALGTLISPLMTKPFLSIRPEDLDKTKAKASGGYNDNITEFQSVVDSDFNSNGDDLSTTFYSVAPTHDKSNSEPNFELQSLESSTLFIPFTIGGCVVILGAIFILLLFHFMKYVNPKHSRGEGKVRKPETPLKDVETVETPVETVEIEKNSHRIVLVILSAVFLGAYSGMEVCSMQFIPTFTHYIDLKLSTPDGALVLSFLTGSFTLGRAIGIVIVLRVIPEALLLGNFVLVILGNATLLFLANSSAPFLYAGSVLLGIGFSTVFPSFYGYIEKHLKITNVVGAVMIVAGGFVSALYPIVIGSRIEENPFVLIYTNFFSVVVCITTFVIIYVVTSRKTTYAPSAL